MGGSDGLGNISSFYIAAVNGNGSLGSWSSGTSLPLPIYTFAVANNNSYIFLTGGEDNYNNAQSTVYSMALPAPPVVPTLTARNFTNGNFQLQLASHTNTGFGLLASPDLINWTNLGWGFTDTNGLASLSRHERRQFPQPLLPRLLAAAVNEFP